MDHALLTLIDERVQAAVERRLRAVQETDERLPPRKRGRARSACDAGSGESEDRELTDPRTPATRPGGTTDPPRARGVDASPPDEIDSTIVQAERVPRASNGWMERYASAPRASVRCATHLTGRGAHALEARDPERRCATCGVTDTPQWRRARFSAHQWDCNRCYVINRKAVLHHSPIEPRRLCAPPRAAPPRRDRVQPACDDDSVSDYPVSEDEPEDEPERVSTDRRKHSTRRGGDPPAKRRRRLASSEPPRQGARTPAKRPPAASELFEVKRVVGHFDKHGATWYRVQWATSWHRKDDLPRWRSEVERIVDTRDDHCLVEWRSTWQTHDDVKHCQAFLDYQARLRSAGGVPEVSSNQSTESKRIAQILALLRLKEEPMAKDGNCQFRALAHQIYGNANRHREVRRRVVEYMEQHPQTFRCVSRARSASRCLRGLTGGVGGHSEFVVRGRWATYLTQMRKSGEYGDERTLAAAAEVYKTRIYVVHGCASVQARGAFDRARR
jgi:hypothetical protein